MARTRENEEEEAEVRQRSRRRRRSEKMLSQKLTGKWKLSCAASAQVIFRSAIILLVVVIASEDVECAGGSAPRFTIQPNDLVAIEGESTELNCDAEGEPEPKIEWHHNGQPIRSSSQTRTTMGGSIQFLDIRPDPVGGSGGANSDAGTYYCLATNVHGQARSRNASLQVAYIKEKFLLAPAELQHAELDVGQATFECLPVAWPEPEIQWRRDGQPLEPSAKYAIERIAKSVRAGETAPAAAVESPGQLVDLFGSRLIVRQPAKVDEAKYSCLVQTKGSHRLIERKSPEGQLKVAVKPHFIERPENKQAQVGGQVQLRCRMGGDPEPVISWRRQDGAPLSEKITIDPSDKTLILDKLRSSDQGIYICEGENAIGSARAMAQVSVSFRPKFTAPPSDQEVDPGARIQIKCSGDASPPPMLFWYKEGHRQLIFPSNSADRSNFGWQTHANALQHMSSPSTPITSDTSPAINKLFTMHMNHDQFSLPEYNHNYFAHRIYVDNQGTLNIINATTSDSGYYACALVSPVGSIMAKAKVTIRGSLDGLLTDSYASYQDPFRMRNNEMASSGSNKYDLLPPPVIKMGTSNQTLPTNTSTELLCEVVSQVAYKIQWFFNSQTVIEDPPRVAILESGALAINNLRVTDSGLYSCVVTAATEMNMPLASPLEPLDSSMLTAAPPVQQSASHSCMLKVANPINPNIQFYKMDMYAYPSPPGSAYLVSNNGNDAITISWTPPADSGALPIKQYVVEHFDTSQESLGWRVIHRPNGKETLLIDGLSAEGSHFFVIRATNNHGTGPSSAIAGPMRTNAGEARYQFEVQKRNNPLNSIETRPGASVARDKLMYINTNLINVTPISSNSIRLQWNLLSANDSQTDDNPQLNYPLLSVHNIGEFIEGFSIRYRALSVGVNFAIRESTPSWTGYPSPSTLPLVTSFIDEPESISSGPMRSKRDVTNYVDYTQEFNEVRVADHATETYTINNLKPFTFYQFFVVPYYKDIDGIPSNILTAQTHEDRPTVAPNLRVRAINDTAIRLLWIDIPPAFTNGILKSYTVRMNRSDILNSQNTDKLSIQSMSMAPEMIRLPLANLMIRPLTAFYPEAKIQPNINNAQLPNVVTYDITNLTYKSFYSVQVAGETSVGLGPWSDSQNFVMDSKILMSQTRSQDNEIEDVMSKSMISDVPQSYDGSNRRFSSSYVVLLMIAITMIVIIVGFLIYRRDHQKVTTWKKTISEHFTNKFYMPSVVNQHRGPGSIQQNIYDHQQHLIYSAGSAHMVQQAPTMWATSANGNPGANCFAASATGSLSSHGGLVPISTDPNATRSRVTNEQILMNNGNKDANSYFVRGNQTNNQHLNSSDDPNCSLSHQNPNSVQQIVYHGGDYYSIINNVAEYEELDPQRRNNIQNVTSNGDRQQTGSSNSDTSCPSSVTRLLPNQNYNRDLLNRNFIDSQRQELVLQQQIACNIEGKQQPFMTMIDHAELARVQNKAPLSPYATTNLMNQIPSQQQQQLFSVTANNQTIVNGSMGPQQSNFAMHGFTTTMDDSSKVLISQQISGAQNPITSFRTLQRNPVTHQQRAVPIFPANLHHNNQIVVHNQNDPSLNSNSHIYGRSQGNNGTVAYQTGKSHLIANITNNPLLDDKSNVYEHVDYNASQHQINNSNNYPQPGGNSQHMHNAVVSSTSPASGHMPDRHQSLTNTDNQNLSGNNVGGSSRYRRASNPGGDNEAHDLRVFSSVQVSNSSSDSGNELQRLSEDKGSQEDGMVVGDDNPDENSALKASDTDNGSNQRTRQLSKRKRQQQRNRLHNNNQRIG